MTNRSKQKGTRWESSIVDTLQANGFPHAERRALNGNTDKGDITGIPGVVIEAKDCQRVQLAEWVDQATLEGANAAADVAAVWAHRKGRGSPLDGYVVMTGSQFVGLLHDAGHGWPPEGGV